MEQRSEKEGIIATREFPSYFPKRAGTVQSVIAEPYKALNGDENRRGENEKNGWKGEREGKKER